MEIKANILIGIDELDIINGTLSLPSNIIEIGDSVFLNNQEIEKIEIPSSIKKIGFKAFSNCQNLKEIFIKDGLEEISAEAFKDCLKLSRINLPETLQTIGQKAFQNCTNLITIELPKGISQIESYAFSNCSSLSNVSILSNIKEIKEGLFENCTNLKNVKFNNELEKIEFEAFKNNRKLNQIEFPERLKEIETNAFWGCEVLKKVKFNNALEKIGDYSFGDTKVEIIELPASLKQIGITPFHMCYQLVTLKMNKLFHNEILDETNSKLREFFLNQDKLEVLKPVKRIINYKGLIIIKYLDQTFQIITKPIQYYDKKYFETAFPQSKVTNLMKDEKIYNIYYWESILGHDKVSSINPIAIIAIPPNSNSIKAYFNKMNIYDELISKHNLEKFDDVLAMIKFITIFGGLCKKNNNVEKYINLIGIKNITKQFKNTEVRELNQKFLNIYLKLLENYSVKQINEIMPFLYNEIGKVSTLENNFTIEDIEALQYTAPVAENERELTIIKYENNSPNYEWLDNSNTVNLLWGFILGSVSEKNINVSDQERTVRTYNIKDEEGLIVATTRAYYNEEEKYLLFNSINLSQSFVTKGYDVETIKKLLIDYVLISIEEILNFLNEKEAKVSKVHVGISEKNIKEQLVTRGTKIINQNI